MIDYELITKNLKDKDIIKLMYSLGADRHEETETYILFPTICHNVNAQEASMKLYYYKDNHFFYCYTQDGGMNIFKFLEEYYNTRNYKYDWYNDIYRTVVNCSVDPKDDFNVVKHPSLHEKYKHRPSIELKTYSDTVLDVFTKQYPVEWLNDGINKETMDKFNILYSISQNKIIIPHYNVNNELIGIRGRALNESDIEWAKYAPVKIENTTYKHKLSLNLYGLNINKDYIKRTGICYLFEAEKSVLQLDSFGNNCGLAACGSNFNIYQLKLLLQTCMPKEIVICFDQEEERGEEKYFYKLLKMCNKYKKYCNISFVYDRENLLNLKDSPSDKGKDVFYKLLNKRVIV